MSSSVLVSLPLDPQTRERPFADVARRTSLSTQFVRGGADVQTSGAGIARRLRVLLIDERPATSDRVSAALGGQSSVDVLAHTDDSSVAISLAMRVTPDVCLVSRIDRLKHLERPPRVLLYVDIADAEIAAAAMCAEADGVISRASVPAQIAAAIETVAAGGRLFPTVQSSTARRLADLVGDGDRVIVSMLLLRHQPDDIAQTLGIGLGAFHARRRQILRELDSALSAAHLGPA
jgi:DNA-binding NarL/FixJ family response regulator